MRAPDLFLYNLDDTYESFHIFPECVCHSSQHVGLRLQLRDRYVAVDICFLQQKDKIILLALLFAYFISVY